MNYKIQGAFKKGRTTIIVASILWLLLAVVFIMPWTCGCYQNELLGRFEMDAFMNVFVKTVTDPIRGFGAIFGHNLFFNYLKNLFGFTLFYVIIVAIGIIRMMPKHRYDDIEHGSSDWSEGGEQYQVLSKKEGIILAENNYLPIDKRGNVNVLVVGRFWFW